jgi:hypothetical protein
VRLGANANTSRLAKQRIDACRLEGSIGSFHFCGYEFLSCWGVVLSGLRISKCFLFDIGVRIALEYPYVLLYMLTGVGS